MPFYFVAEVDSEIVDVLNVNYIDISNISLLPANYLHEFANLILANVSFIHRPN